MIHTDSELIEIMKKEIELIEKKHGDLTKDPCFPEQLPYKLCELFGDICQIFVLEEVIALPDKILGRQTFLKVFRDAFEGCRQKVINCLAECGINPAYFLDAEGSTYAINEGISYFHDYEYPKCITLFDPCFCKDYPKIRDKIDRERLLMGIEKMRKRVAEEYRLIHAED